MTITQLKAVMIFQLTNFNDEGENIDDDTIHDAVLDDDYGFGHANSMNIYKDAIRMTLVKQGHILKKWPKDWMDLSVKELAPQIL